MKYKDAGVDIDAAAAAKKEIKKLVKGTYNRNVLSGVGLFGALYELKSYDNPVLVSSVDTIGTKVKLAFQTGKHDTIGIDIVNHCVNDILVQGAKPLFFMDYLPMHKMDPAVVKAVVTGLAKGCKDNKIALVGGDTPELPELYGEGEYDLAGFILGVVEKKAIVTGADITPKDTIIGLPSSGLHTNGYTLARKVLDVSNKDVLKDLMIPHRSYLHDVSKLHGIPIKGMAHITGGGLIDNIPRILPKGCEAHVTINWSIPKIFTMIQEQGAVPKKDMFRTFNMGMGYIIVVRQEDSEDVLRKISDARVIGHIEKGESCVILS